jgi:hypothetical protein
MRLRPWAAVRRAPRALSTERDEDLGRPVKNDHAQGTFPEMSGRTMDEWRQAMRDAGWTHYAQDGWAREIRWVAL